MHLHFSLYISKDLGSFYICRESESMDCVLWVPLLKKHTGHLLVKQFVQQKFKLLRSYGRLQAIPSKMIRHNSTADNMSCLHQVTQRASENVDFWTLVCVLAEIKEYRQAFYSVIWHLYQRHKTVFIGKKNKANFWVALGAKDSPSFTFWSRHNSC